MISEALITLATFLAMFIFACMNTYAAKNVHGLLNSFKYTLMTFPIQVAGVMLLAYTYNMGFRYFGDRIWVINLIVTFALFSMSLLVNWFMLRQIPIKGEIIGFILMLIGAIIAIMWK